MPGYMHSLEWLRTLWPLLVVTAVISLTVWLGYIQAVAPARQAASAAKVSTGTDGDSAQAEPRPKGSRLRSENGKALLVIFSFSMLGVTIGWLTGDSGQQVLASVLPAVLTLIGGLAVFLVGKQYQDGTMIAAALTGLTLNLLVGALLASENTLLAKEVDREATVQTFRSQVRAATGLQTDSDVSGLQQKILEEQQQPQRASPQ